MKEYKEIILDENKSEYLYVQLYNVLKQKIIDNEIKPNAKLLPIRKFSDLINVNKTTIIKAYKMLEEEHYVYKKVGSGTYVYDIESNDDYFDSGYIKYSKIMINFGSGMPSEELFPVNDFKEAINYVLDEYKGDAFGYQDSKGDESLRRIIFNMFVEEKMNVTKDQIQIISGAQQGIDIVSKAILNARDFVMIESPTYTGAIAIFKSRGCQFTTIDIDYKGIDFDKFEEKLKKYRPKVFFTMPNLQNPTGYTYTKNEKIKILELSKKYKFYIVEDDYSSELNFLNNEISTLKELDDEERVIYIKSFSKIFLPGLRLGYLIMPKCLEKKITSAKHSTDIYTSGLIQKSFEVFLKNGKWTKQFNSIYKVFEEKFYIALNVFEENLPVEITLNKPLGGVNFWLEFDKSVDITKLYEYLLRENIIVAPGNVFFLNNKKSNHIRISIASIEKNKLKENLVMLCSRMNIFLNEENKSKFIQIL
jgi:DNA-binding transcriptional MocR family regulator